MQFLFGDGTDCLGQRTRHGQLPAAQDVALLRGRQLQRQHPGEPRLRVCRDVVIGHLEIDVEVRIAVDNLRSAREQLTAANETLKLAEGEIEQAQLRFEAQVTTQVDVVDAQARLAQARSSQVNAVYGVRAAEVEFLRATGKSVSTGVQPSSF